MQLLTLEAHVVVETDGGLEPGELEPSPGLGSSYARAIEVLEQGAKTLDHHA